MDKTNNQTKQAKNSKQNGNPLKKKLLGHSLVQWTFK